METFRKKSTFFKKSIVILSMLLILSTITFPIYSHAEVVNDPETEYLDVKSPIVLEFESPIEWNTNIPYYAAPFTSSPSNAHHGITLTNNNTLTPVLIDIAINGRKLIITPASPLKMNTEYTLEVTDHIVLKLNSGTANTTDNQVLDFTVSPLTSQSYDIQTGFLTFEDLMTGNEAKINDIITNYTPRKINVTAPVRYVDEVKIIHKRPATVQDNTTESVTNIDISITDKGLDNPNGDIKRIIVTPTIDGKEIDDQDPKIIDHLNAVPNVGKKIYDFGFTKLPKDKEFDIKVILDNDDDDKNIPLDVRIVKVPLEAKETTTITQKDRYLLSGKTFTLYQLLDKPKDLQTLLNGNRMNEIKVQVVQK